MKNAFTIDVEDYFQVEAFSKVVNRNNWPKMERRVERNTDQILALLDNHNIKATFFILGWVAERQPEIVKKIAQQGHEIASHGYSHKTIYSQTPAEFREETRQSKTLLEDICQQPVIGYRAATYSITERSLWAMDILVEEGFQYDSSIFPMRHDNYGIPDINPAPHIYQTNSGPIAEMPISVLKYKQLTIPVAGGGYFRLWPYAFTRWALNQITKHGDEFVFYIHPWEIDPEQPRIENAGLLSRFRHYNNLGKCHSRLEKLFQDFDFDTLRNLLEDKNLLVNGKVHAPVSSLSNNHRATKGQIL